MVSCEPPEIFWNITVTTQAVCGLCTAKHLDIQALCAYTVGPAIMAL